MRRILIVLSAMILSGCAALFNPHVVPITEATSCPAHIEKLDGALLCADAWSDAYRKALGKQAKLRTWSGVSLIALSGVAFGSGVTGGSTDTLAWLAAAGAIGYGASNWLSNKPAQLAYVAGMKAISCAVTVVEPLSHMPKGGAAFESLVDTLNSNIETTESLLRVAMNAKVAYEVSGGQRPVYEEAGRQFGLAKAGIANAATVHESGVGLVGKEKGAAQSLVNTISRISREVDGIIVQSLPSLQSLPGVIDGMAQASGMFTSLGDNTLGPSGTKLPNVPELNSEETPRLKTELQTALDNLDVSISAMNRNTRLVVANVNAVSDTIHLDTLIGCGVDEEQLAPALTISPAQKSISNATDTNHRLYISGGRAPYMAVLLEDPVENLKVSQPAPFGQWVLLELKTGTPVGTYTIHITDGAGAFTQTSLIISGSQGADTGGGKKPPASACPKVGKELTENEIKLEMSEQQLFEVQRVSQAVVDGKIGDETRKKICAYQKSYQLEESGEITQELLDQANQDSEKMKGIVKGAKNPYERRLDITPDYIKELQKILGVPQTGELDDATRQAITSFSAPDGVKDPEKPDELNKELVETLDDSG